jgi:hypothetical protein
MKESGGAAVQTSQLAVDPTLVAHAAGRLVAAAQASGDLFRRLLSTLDLGPGAWSSLAGGGQLARAHGEALGSVAATLDLLTQVLEGDADRLYQVAFSLRAADVTAAMRVRR